MREGLDSPQGSIPGITVKQGILSGSIWILRLISISVRKQISSGSYHAFQRLPQLCGSLLYLGQEETARQWLNKVRNRAGITTGLTETGAALEKRIRNERQVELCFEGHRYYDVRRWKVAEVTQSQPAGQVIITRAANGTKSYLYKDLEQRIFKPGNYLLPIPKTEIRKDGIASEPGYN